MDINPVDLTATMTEVAKESPLAAFMLFVIVFLLLAVATLYRRNTKVGDDSIRTLTELSGSMKNIEKALESVITKIERLLYGHKG